MPRGGKKRKTKEKGINNMDHHGNQPDVIVIDGDDSDSNSVNDQVQNLQISPDQSLNRSSYSTKMPSWGMGARDNDRNSQRRDTTMFQTHTGLQSPPSLSGFLSFSDNRGLPLHSRSKAFVNQHKQMSVQSPGIPQALGLPFAGVSSHNPRPLPQMVVPLMQPIPVPSLPANVQGRLLPMLDQGASGSMQKQIPSTSGQGLKWAPNLYSTESEFPKGQVRSGHPPGTKIVKDTQPVSIRKHPARGGYLNVNEVNASIQECKEILTKAGEHVSMERLEAMVLEKYQVKHFSQLNLQMRNIGQMPTAFEHSRLMSKVNSYAHSFVRARSMCTLFELGECLREFHKDKLEYEKLELGPLQAMPVVYELFKFPMDEYIPEITSMDIIEHLNGYLDSSDKWKDKVELDNFLEYLVAMYQVESPFSLGVRIRSIPLAIQMLKKSKRDAAQSRKNMLQNFGSMFVEDIKSAISKFRESILKDGPDSDSPELRVHYASLEPLEAIKEIYTKFEVLSALMQGEGTAATQARMNRFHSSFASFKKTIESDPLTRQLFHLAVSLSVTDVQESATEFLDDQRKPREANQGAETSGKPKKKLPSKSSIVDKIIHFINQCLQDGSLHLSHLKRIEEKLVEVFEFPSFDEFGQGAFLYFLLSNSKIKELLDDCGGAMLGSISSSSDKARYYHSTFHDLKEFVCQTKLAGVTQTPQVASVMCEQFNVKEVKTLGQGSVGRLCQAASVPGKHVASQYNCLYEAALCGKACAANQSAQRVGRLGNQSNEKAKAALTSCPLLDDLGEWSQWHLVFQPEHGDLRDFVAKFGGRQLITISGGKREAVSDFMALETAPGKLLKISSQSTPDLFNQALEAGDPLMAAGHLASIVANSRGIESSPLALLANQVKTKLLSLRAEQGAITSLSHTEREDPKIALIVAIMMRLPVRICAAVADQVLLEPLNQVVGAAKSKVAVLHLCSQLPWQRDRLECLGILLGIPEWAESLQAKMTFPAHLVHDVVVDELFGQTISDEEDEVVEVADEESEDDNDDDDDNADFCEISSEEEQNEEEVNDSPGDNENETIESDDKNAEKNVDLIGDENDKRMDKEGKSKDSGEEEDDTNKLDAEAEGDGNEEDQDEKDDEEKEEKEKEEVTKPLTREDICHRVVDMIRREEFGVGVELSEEAQKLMKTQQERQGRSLNRLSRDLYSKDTHFVLELIQNADDNTYDDDILPCLNFVIDASGVTIQNNELGFEDRNIRALCDVGKSTKSKHVLGYIGQKGIGFKSVFRVTDRPEIHSNGFHICFDVMSGPMGYIMPHWIDEPPTSSESWQTQILLPWTDTIKGQIETHAARFNDIQPSLLLFLHRLREITITNKVEGCEMKMSRKDLPTGEVQISHSYGVDRWLVVRKILDATQVSVEAKSGVDVQSTEIALAFPLKNKSSTLGQGTRLGQLPVFAFLPLQSYGFRFIVQGDFNVPSSREAVDKDSCWNQWLRDRIPALFLQAWDSFLNLPDMSPMEAFIQFLQFIPLEGEVMGFFSPVTSQIRSQLMAKDCMPVISTSGNKDDIVWKSPSKTVMTERSLVRDIISPRLLLLNLGLYYLHWDVLESVDHGTLRALGVHTIGTDHLLQIGQGISSHWDCQGSPGQVVELAKWLACVYCSLDSFKDNTEVLGRLTKMRLIPLSDGSLVSMEDMTVFLLAVDGHDTNTTHTKATMSKPKYDPLQALRRDVNIIHPDLTSTPDPEVNSQVTKLLSRLDIKEMNPHDLFYSHVLPVLKSDAWKGKSKEVLICYLVCAKQVLFDSGEDLTPLKEVARVITSRGEVKLPSQDDVHFSLDYGNSVDLVKVFPSISWALLSPAYLPPEPSKTVKESWHKFFFSLGVRDFLCINQIDVPLDHNNLLKSPWAQYKDLWQDLPDEFVIEDFTCEEFQMLISDTSMPFNSVCRLYVLLDAAWDEIYRKSVLTKVKAMSGEVLKSNIETSFAIQLKTRPWVPARWVTVTTDTKLEKACGLQLPSCLYCSNIEVENLLANTAKYLAVKIPSKSPFTSFLQIKSSVQKEAVKEALISWGQRPEGKANVPVMFSTSVDHIVNVYEFLQSKFTPVEIQKLFHAHPVIFIAPCDNFVSSNSTIAGHMMHREEVWWTDQCGIFSKYRTSLEKYNDPLAKFKFLLPFYQKKQNLFSIARIDQTHNMLHLAQLLKHITSVFTLEDKGVLQDVLTLISAIGQALSKTDDTQAGVRTQEAQIALELRDKVKTFLSDASVFPTKAMKLVGIKDSPMIADSKEWEKMFEGKPNVHFLLLESPQSSFKRHNPQARQGFGGQTVDPEYVQCFLDLFEDIKLLSGNVGWEEITVGFKPCVQGQKYLHDIVGVLQQFLYFSFHDAYSEFKSNNAGQLKDLIFTEVEWLDVKYELKDRPDVYELRPENCIIKGNHFYFLSKNIDNQSEINKEVARYFGNNDDDCIREIRNFLSQAVPILEGKSKETLPNLLARQRNQIDDLPEEEELWEVPLPTVINPSYVAPVPSDMGQEEYVVYDRQDSTMPLHPSGGSQDNSGDQGGGAGIKSWPPRSLPESDIPQAARPGSKKTVSKFTPPEAPDYIKASKKIPANFRFENDPDASKQETGDGGERVGATGGKPGGGGERVGATGGKPGGGGGVGDGGDVERRVAHPTESGDGIRKETGSKIDATERQASLDEDPAVGQSRGKRKLLSESASSGEEGESQTPASKRQSLETKDEENPTAVADSQCTMPATERVDSSGGEGAGVRTVDSNTRPFHMGQGLVAVSRQMPENGAIDKDPRRPYRGGETEGKILHFNIPTWGHQPDNLAFTELTSDISKINLQYDLGDQPDKDKIGRWGEMLVHDYLRQHMLSNDTVEDVIWANAAEEQGMPYDFEMILKTDSSDESGNEEVYSVFIEVKATRKDEKALFEISAHQVEFAFNVRERYQIFRVFGAGKDTMRLVRIDNIADRMKNKSVKLFMVI